MGKTVTTYLIDGDPKGTQYAFISNKICQMFVVPRSNLSYLNTQEKLQKPAFYILLGGVWSLVRIQSPRLMKILDIQSNIKDFSFVVYSPKNGGGTQVVHKWSPFEKFQ